MVLFIYALRWLYKKKRAIESHFGFMSVSVILRVRPKPRILSISNKSSS
uniref:Uncharacterized protein n=1 Tax=Anguilla anguilla TaxID=7936 RepID=A0A0E9R6H5_ANGAN